MVTGNVNYQLEHDVEIRCGWLVGWFFCWLFVWLVGWWVASEVKKQGIKKVTIAYRFFACRKWAELILSVFCMRKLCLVPSSYFVRHLVTVTKQVYVSDYLKIHKYYIYIYIYIKKVKWSRYRPGEVQRVGRVIALLFHDRGTRRGCVVSSTLRPHFIPGKDPVPILQEAEWAPGPVWTGEKSRPHRDSIPDRPACS